MTWEKMLTLNGEIKTAEKFTAAVIEQTGEDLFGLENQEEYERIIKSGWVTFENGKTVVWKDNLFFASNQNLRGIKPWK